MKFIIVSSNKETSALYAKELEKVGLETIPVNEKDKYHTYDDDKIIEFRRKHTDFVIDKNDITSKSVLILPPNAAKQVLRAFKETSFLLLYIDNDEKSHEFKEFRNEVTNNGVQNLPYNCCMIRILRDIDMTVPDEVSKFKTEIQMLRNTAAYHQNLMTVVNDMMKKNVIDKTDDNHISMSFQNQDGKHDGQTLSIDECASYLMLPSAKETFQYFMSQYLCTHSLALLEEYEKRLFKKEETK